MRSINLIILLAALFCISCGKDKNDYDASGSFEATEIIVSSQAAGQILALDINEGQSIKQGQTVGYVDTTQLHLKKRQLFANMKAMDGRFYNVALQIASLKQQIEKQEKELARFRNLAKENAATQKDVDDIQTRLHVLQKELAAQTESLQNSNRSVSGELTALQIQAEQTDDLIRKSIFASPADGIVLAKYAEAGEMAGAGSPLFKIADMDNIFLRAYITEDQLTRLKLNQSVRVFADYGSEMKEYTGLVTWISDKAEFTPKTIQTKNERANKVYAIKISVKNDGLLKIGMYGEVNF